MLQVGIIGDYDESKPTHPATSQALVQAGEALGERAQVTWIGTAAVGHNGSILDAYDAIVASPGSPYADFYGALAGIQYVREHRRPFLGT